MYKLVLLIFISLTFTYAKGQGNNPSASGSKKSMVFIAQNTFMMGIDSVELQKDLGIYSENRAELLSENPAFRVMLHAFYLDKYQVTNAGFKKFLAANPNWAKGNVPDSLADVNYLKDWQGNNYPKGTGKLPVVYVSWFAARAYAYWSGKRLPLEAEMEYASKYQENVYTEFPWGNALPDTLKANYAASNIRHVTPVEKYLSNALGLYDMAGNVWEFCADNWRASRHITDTGWTQTKKVALYINETVIKGGSFNSSAFDLRATRRDHRAKNTCLSDLGFRCAMTDMTTSLKLQVILKH